MAAASTVNRDSIQVSMQQPVSLSAGLRTTLSDAHTEQSLSAALPNMPSDAHDAHSLPNMLSCTTQRVSSLQIGLAAVEECKAIEAVGRMCLPIYYKEYQLLQFIRC